MPTDAYWHSVLECTSRLLHAACASAHVQELTSHCTTVIKMDAVTREAGKDAKESRTTDSIYSTPCTLQHTRQWLKSPSVSCMFADVLPCQDLPISSPRPCRTDRHGITCSSRASCLHSHVGLRWGSCSPAGLTHPLGSAKSAGTCTVPVLCCWWHLQMPLSWHTKPA